MFELKQNASFFCPESILWYFGRLGVSLDILAVRFIKMCRSFPAVMWLILTAQSTSCLSVYSQRRWDTALTNRRAYGCMLFQQPTAIFKWAVHSTIFPKCAGYMARYKAVKPLPALARLVFKFAFQVFNIHFCLCLVKRIEVLKPFRILLVEKVQYISDSLTLAFCV